MKKSFDRPGKLFRLLAALALILALVPFSCFGEAAPAQEATPEQIYTNNSWKFDVAEDYGYSEEDLTVLHRVYLWVYNDSIADWCKEEAENAGHPISYQEAAESIHDLVRYTMAATPDTLVSFFKTTREKLEAKGYRFVKIKNSWENYSINAPYRGVNTQIEAPSGIVFELQFHTAESLVTKSIAYGMYEITRDPRIPETEKVDLLKQSYELYDRLTAPDGISEIVPLK